MGIAGIHGVTCGRHATGNHHAGQGGLAVARTWPDAAETRPTSVDQVWVADLICVDAGRVRVRRLPGRRVLPPDPGLAGVDQRGKSVEWHVARWVHWYNHQRLHSLIGNVPPVEFEHHHRQATTVTPTPEVA